jgi:hypothetical protein
VPALAAAEAGSPFARAQVERRERTEALVRRWSLASPGLAVQLLADHIAGTSTGRFAAFERHAVAAERVWHDVFGPRIMRLQELSRADMDRVPRPTAFRATPTLWEIAWPTGSLLAAAIVAGAILHRSLPHLKG